MKLNNFLNPKYIAVIGASSDKNKLGRKVFDNIIATKKSAVFPINLKDKQIAGFKAYQDIKLLNIKDWSNLLALIVIPAKFVLAELEKCAEMGVKDIIIISAGFKEVGNHELEDKIVLLAKKHKLNILGPNCLGYINGKNNLNLSFANYNLNKNINRKHNIAFLSQSGAIASAILDWLADKNIGLSYFISLGNKAVLNENDFLEFLLKDKSSDLIVAYLEEISQGARFMNLVSKISKIKPVAILKAGRTSLGGEMAISHTASMAGSYEASLTALKRSGAIILEDITQIHDLMSLIKEPLKDLSGGLAVISNAGGPAVLLADECSEKNLKLAKFSKETLLKMKKVLPDFSNFKNPLDILGDAEPSRYEQALKIVLADSNVSAVLVLLTPQSMTKPEEVARILAKHKKKLLIACFMGGQEVEPAKKVLAESLIPNFDSPERAIDILSKLFKYLKDKKELKVFNEKQFSVNSNNYFVEDYIKGFQFLKDKSIDIVMPKKLNKSNLNKIKYPIVVKFTGPDFIHKSDQRAIFLKVKNNLEAESIINKFNRKNSNTENYIVYQPMIKSQHELILGFKRDLVFGPILLLGFGGIYSEIYKDISLEIADLDIERVKAMIKKLKLFPILNGARGFSPINFKLLEKTILTLSKIAREQQDILEMDINPLFVDSKNVLAVDVRIVKNN